MKRWMTVISLVMAIAAAGCAPAAMAPLPTATPSPTPTVEVRLMSSDEILATAPERIEQYRKGDARIRVVDASGQPVPNAQVSVSQTRHAFLFGANIYMLNRLGSPEANQAYAERFAALFNYATLRFYWGEFEAVKGLPNYEQQEQVARWAREHGITPKGHPLLWHTLAPSWLPPYPEKVTPLAEQRVRDVVSHYRGLIDVWDVVNEPTVAAEQMNQIGLWMKTMGTARATAEALRWAREANPEATLLVNDYRTDMAFHHILEEVRAEGGEFDAIGLQSHMHKGPWPFSQVWAVAERFRDFGVPLHFTEVTVLSGDLMTNNDWSSTRSHWPSTPEGEERQAKYVANLYTVLFSHPSVEAVTWWDFSDAGAWLGAPAGLLRADLTPKPAYDELMRLIKGEWWTQLEGSTDRDGALTFRGFYGDYHIVVQKGKTTAEADFQLRRDQPAEITIVLPGP